MTPKQVDKEERRKEIAAAAMALFVEKGYESASVREIAEAAGIGKGSIYEYFESKEELAFQAMVVWVERMEQGVDALLAEIDDPVERLRAYVRGAMDAFLADDRTIRAALAMIQMLVQNPESARKFHVTRELFRGVRRTIVDTLRDGVSRGLFRPSVAENAEKIAINLAAYLDGIGLHYYLDKRYCDLGEQMDLYMDRLFQDLLVEPQEGP